MKPRQQELYQTVLRIVRRVIRNKQMTTRLENLVWGIVNERVLSDDVSHQKLVTHVVQQICQRLSGQRTSGSNAVEQFNTNAITNLHTARF